MGGMTIRVGTTIHSFAVGRFAQVLFVPCSSCSLIKTFVGMTTVAAEETTTRAVVESTSNATIAAEDNTDILGEESVFY